MQYAIKVLADGDLYAHVIEASTEHGALEAARALHVKPGLAALLTEPVLVREDGRVAVLGENVESFRGETFRLDGMAVGLHEASTGRVQVSQKCEGCKSESEHQYWCNGLITAEYFPSVFELRWVKPSAQQ